jgi:hypothetical protein
MRVTPSVYEALGHDVGTPENQEGTTFCEMDVDVAYQAGF